MQKRVLVVSGGISAEREVSLRSGSAVERALGEAGYMTSQYDPHDGLDGLLPAARGADVCFIVLHGAGGEDGSIQRILESASIPFVGSGSTASELCFNKWQCKQFYQKQSIPTPQAELVTYDTYLSHLLAGTQHVLKPFDGGSSIDTFIVRDPSTRDISAIQQAFNNHKQLLLEELIIGNEITVAVLDDQALPIIEIIPPIDQEFDYSNKYNGATQELCPPKNISDELQTQAKTLAQTIHTTSGCRAMSRTDMMIDQTGALWVLETNTIPGMTDQSLLPKAAAAAGISMPDLVDRLVLSALR